MVEWLIQLGYGTKSPVKCEFKAGLHSATTGKLFQPSRNGFLVRIREG